VGMYHPEDHGRHMRLPRASLLRLFRAIGSREPLFLIINPGL